MICKYFEQTISINVNRAVKSRYRDSSPPMQNRTILPEVYERSTKTMAHLPCPVEAWLQSYVIFFSIVLDINQGVPAYSLGGSVVM